VVYEGLAKDLIWQLKFQGARAAARQMACHMPSPHEPVDYIVPVPTATSRVRRRGYDQAKLLARELAKRDQLVLLDCLSRSGQAHQVGASRRERLRQLQAAFRVRSAPLIKGRRIMLVDDVVTTGATLEAAATVLRAAGAKSVDAMVFAQP
jgi:ComF family protein